MTLKERAAAVLAAAAATKVTIEIAFPAPVSFADREAVAALTRYAFDHGLTFSQGEDPDSLWVVVTLTEG